MTITVELKDSIHYMDDSMVLTYSEPMKFRRPPKICTSPFSSLVTTAYPHRASLNDIYITDTAKSSSEDVSFVNHEPRHIKSFHQKTIIYFPDIEYTKYSNMKKLVFVLIELENADKKVFFVTIRVLFHNKRACTTKYNITDYEKEKYETSPEKITNITHVENVEILDPYNIQSRLHNAVGRANNKNHLILNAQHQNIFMSPGNILSMFVLFLSNEVECNIPLMQSLELENDCFYERKNENSNVILNFKNPLVYSKSKENPKSNVVVVINNCMIDGGEFTHIDKTTHMPPKNIPYGFVNLKQFAENIDVQGNPEFYTYIDLFGFNYSAHLIWEPDINNNSKYEEIKKLGVVAEFPKLFFMDPIRDSYANACEEISMFINDFNDFDIEEPLKYLSLIQLRTLLTFSLTKAIFTSFVRVKDEEQDPTKEYKNEICFVLAKIENMLVPCVLCANNLFYEVDGCIQIVRYDELEGECVYYEFLESRYEHNSVDPLVLICLLCRDWTLFHAIERNTRDPFHFIAFVMLRLLSEWNSDSFSFHFMKNIILKRHIEYIITPKSILSSEEMKSPIFDKYRESIWFSGILEELESDLMDSTMPIFIEYDDCGEFSDFIVDYFSDKEKNDFLMDQIKIISIFVEFISGKPSKIREIVQDHTLDTIQIECNMCDKVRNYLSLVPNVDDLRYFSKIMKKIEKNDNKQTETIPIEKTQ